MPIPLPSLRPTPPPRRGRNFVKIGVAAAAIVGLLYSAYSFTPNLRSRAAEMPLTATITRGELKIVVSERGELESIDAITVCCETRGGGKLMTIIPEGTRVAKDDIVCQLDPEPYTKMLNDQRVKCEVADNKVKTLKADLTQAESKAGTEIAKAEKVLKLAKIELEAYTAADGEYTQQIEDLNGKLELAKKNLVEAEDELEFTKKQVRKGFGDLNTVKAKEFAVAEKKFMVASSQAARTVLESYGRKKKIAELEFNASDAERELVRTKAAQESAVEKAKNEVKAADATAKIEKEQLDSIEKQIEACTIKAPGSGIVVYSNSRFWDDSSRIRPGAQLYNRQEIFSLPDLSKMRAKVRIHEAAIKKVRPGMPVTMTLDSLANKTLHGKVLKIATIAQSDGWRGAGVKQYETEISIDDLPSDAGLKPGMTVEIKILSNTLQDVILVPVSAITDYEGKRVVYVVRGKSIDRVEVEPGEANDQYVQIVSGLAEGEVLALDARSRAAADLKAAKSANEKKK